MSLPFHQIIAEAIRTDIATGTHDPNRIADAITLAQCALTSYRQAPGIRRREELVKAEFKIPPRADFMFVKLIVNDARGRQIKCQLRYKVKYGKKHAPFYTYDNISFNCVYPCNGSFVSCKHFMAATEAFIRRRLHYFCLKMARTLEDVFNKNWDDYKNFDDDYVEIMGC